MIPCYQKHLRIYKSVHNIKLGSKGNISIGDMYTHTRVHIKRALCVHMCVCILTIIINKCRWTKGSHTPEQSSFPHSEDTEEGFLGGSAFSNCLQFKSISGS